jgi:nitrate/nitrite transporter NarK
MSMILLLIPILIVAAGAGLYAAFTSRFWLIVLASIGLLCVFNHIRQEAIQAPMAQAMEDVRTHRDQWAVEDARARWAKQHH